jgi:hypothetical protein
VSGWRRERGGRGDAGTSGRSTALAAELDEQQLMDLVFTIGADDVLAMAFQAFAVEFDDDLHEAADGTIDLI